jgi:outer membrane protein OmpA-like peptidoglycan-associated protein
MTFVKAMPLLLAAITPFVMPAGGASAAETPIILAQFSPHDKDDNKKPQGQQQQHGSGQQQQQKPQGSPPPQPHPQGGSQPPSHSQGGTQPGTHTQGASPQPQMHTQGGTPPQTNTQGSSQPLSHTQGSTQPGTHTQGTTQPLSHTQGSTQPGTHTQGGTQPGTHTLGTSQPQLGTQGSTQPGTHTQGGTQPGTHTLGTSQQQLGTQGSTQQGTHTQGGTQPGTHTLGTSQQQLGTQGSTQQGTHTQGGPQPQAHTLGSTQPGTHTQGGTQLQQTHQPNIAPRHDLSADEKRAKAERESHAAGRAHEIEKQKQMAVQEKSPAALNERMRVQNERMHAISSQRQQSVDAHGQTVIKEPGGRAILQVNGHAFIHHDESANFHAFGGIPQTRRGANGNSISTIVRPDGVRLEIEVDGYGRPLRRVRYLPDGRRFVLFENRALAIGAGLALGALIISLPPVEVDIPPEQYIVDADVASEDDIYGALQAGPIAPLDRAYSLEEVVASVGLRQRMRSINIDSINFDFGSADVPQDQAEMLESVAAAMRDMTNQNPGEVYLIEGHTDAVGSEVDNLSLSDRRAQAIADLLSQQFNIPRENLVTQGYGKQFLLVPTPEPERRNRRVVIRRITPLLQSDAEHYSEGGPGEPDNR